MHLGPAVHGEDERIAFAFFFVERADKDAFEFEAIAHFVLDDFLLGELHVFEPGIVVSEAAGLLVAGRKQINFWRML